MSDYFLRELAKERIRAQALEGQLLDYAEDIRRLQEQVEELQHTALDTYQWLRRQGLHTTAHGRYVGRAGGLDV